MKDNSLGAYRFAVFMDDLLTGVIEEQLFLGLEELLYRHDCMTALLSQDSPTEDVIIYVYDRFE